MEYICGCDVEVECSTCYKGYNCCCLCCKEYYSCELSCLDSNEYGEPSECEYSVRI